MTTFTLNIKLDSVDSVAGQLHIAAITQEDIDRAAGETWKCFISNNVLNVDVGGSETRIVASGEPAGECCAAA